MPIDQGKGSFNLKAVVRETGLKPDTLRAWERRYGLPQPARTPGGHRLYSQRDIDTLRWLAARQGEGLNISRAVELWRELEASGSDPLQIPPYALGEPAPGLVGPTAGQTVGELREAWIEACAALDEKRAEQVLAQALAMVSVETVCFEILRQGMAEIGDAWYRGEWSVQQEHFASALAIRRLEALLAAAPPATRRSRLIVACAPGDRHTFPPLLVALLMRRRGWGVTYLGADVPVERMEESIDAVRPAAVVLSAQQVHSAARLAEMAGTLAARQARVAYGGRVFRLQPALRERIPSDYLGDDLENVVPSLERLLGSPHRLVKPKPPGEEALRALGHFGSRRALIEAEVWQRLEGKVEPRVLADANRFLGRDILAALELGDMALIDGEVDWIEGLVRRQARFVGALEEYWRAYRDGARKHLGPAGRLVEAWLDRVVVDSERQS